MDLAGPINGALRRVPPWSLYIVAAVPVIWVFWAGATGRLGVEPVEAIEHRLGLWGLWLLIAGLCVTPIRRFTGVSLIRFRRAVGVTAFFYILAHMLVWLVLDVQILAQVWADILKRPYITVGMAGFLLMIPLALTSNNWSVRRLGPQAWQRLHRLTYGVALLGGLHFVMLRKGFQLEPLLYLAAILGLLALRLVPKRGRRAVPAE
ncbi:protein-methionine-sulfoxide reductase heme-binding subunit MsrQ [Rhodovulum sp. 12E13]|uniref:protein-methionine-sulfoxide reductase heme-binding subunit MsrQ n=1 Tax=Rhodovulum sp. 12E13 TaxID=2203891 RepID=UPI000E144EE4|nr:protein-methionine-sulfoxide reductase heme-binding subunit MsrQ [Rhodovulum sp. 12E13]RDC69798.1 protein-methionine-sulfoxide reductase heme-binding subunit MsrQ [Rhodovulum sp. 12E13]